MEILKKSKKERDHGQGKLRFYEHKIRGNPITSYFSAVILLRMLACTAEQQFFNELELASSNVMQHIYIDPTPCTLSCILPLAGELYLLVKNHKQNQVHTGTNFFKKADEISINCIREN